MRLLLLCTNLGLLLILLTSVLDANEARQHQHEIMRDRLGPDRLAETEEPLLFKDDEFGEQLILRRLPPPPITTVFAEAGSGYTSNPLLLANGSRSDFLYTATVGGTIQPTVFREWEPALSVDFFAQYQVFRYDRLTPLDFNSQVAGFLASYVLPYQMQAYGGWTGSRLEDRANNTRFYRESQATLGWNKSFRTNEIMLSFLGVQGDLRHADPGNLSRFEYGPYVGVQFRLHEQLPVSLRYRLAHQHYLQNARDDFNSWFTLSLAWYIQPALTFRTQGNFVSNRSNRAQNEYDLVTGRIGASLAYSF